MAAAASKIVDGLGADRVVRFLQGASITLRRAAHADSELLWRWANEPLTRESSFSAAPIPWEEHVDWLRRKLDDPRCFLYIVQNHDGDAVGHVRVDVSEDQVGVIGISIDAAQRGHGYGTTALMALLAEYSWRTAARTVHAFVKSGNETSLRAFQKAGFARLGTTTVRGQEAVQFIHSTT